MTKPVIVIGATNVPDALDPALRRAGRFDREIALGMPDEDARCRILQVLCRNIKVEEGMDFALITKKCVELNPNNAPARFVYLTDAPHRGLQPTTHLPEPSATWGQTWWPSQERSQPPTFSFATSHLAPKIAENV